jgi:hypothetical protein
MLRRRRLFYFIRLNPLIIFCRSLSEFTKPSGQKVKIIPPPFLCRLATPAFSPAQTTCGG